MPEWILIVTVGTEPPSLSLSLSHTRASTLFLSSHLRDNTFKSHADSNVLKIANVTTRRYYKYRTCACTGVYECAIRLPRLHQHTPFPHRCKTRNCFAARRCPRTISPVCSIARFSYIPRPKIEFSTCQIPALLTMCTMRELY